MSRILLAGIVTCGILCGVCMIIALSTSSWMTTCFPVSSILNLGYQSPNSQYNSGIQQAQQLMKGKQMCFDVGLFELSMSVPNLFTSSFKLNQETFAEATTGLLIVSLLLLFSAMILVGLSACSASKNSLRIASAFNYLRLGLVLIIFAKFLAGIGMVVYTIYQAPTVHNPQRFMLEVGTSLQKAMGEFGGAEMQHSSFSHSNSMDLGIHPDPSKMTGSGRRKRQALPLKSSPFPPGQNIDHPFLGNAHDLSQVSDSVAPSYESSNDSDMSRTQEIALFMKLFNPVFGYSFYLGWLGAFFALICAVMTALLYSSMSKGGPADQRVPMV